MAASTDSQHLLAIATDAALQAAPPLVSAFRSEMDFTLKRDRHDIVTAHDREAERRIIDLVLTAHPDSCVLGEEGGATGSGAVRWYVDPIDGTVNFARGIAQWCISIAGEIEGEIAAGIVFDPVAGHLFSAGDRGAFLNGRPLQSRAAARAADAVLLTSFPNARHLASFGAPAEPAQARLLDAFMALRNLGSGALHLAYVAAGWADATLGFQTNPWDVAAGLHLVRQSGGRYAGIGGTGPAVLAPHYYALGKGADYAVLDEVVQAVAGDQRRWREPQRVPA